jgi:hypothetical protein
VQGCTAIIPIYQGNWDCEDQSSRLAQARKVLRSHLDRKKWVWWNIQLWQEV